MTDDAAPFSPATLEKIEEVRSLADSLFGEFEELYWMAVEDMYTRRGWDWHELYSAAHRHKLLTGNVLSSGFAYIPYGL